MEENDKTLKYFSGEYEESEEDEDLPYPDFEKEIKKCTTKQEELEVCQNYIKMANDIVTHDIFPFDDFAVIADLEDVIRKMIEFGISKDDIYSQLSELFGRTHGM